MNMMDHTAKDETFAAKISSSARVMLQILLGSWQKHEQRPRTEK